MALVNRTSLSATVDAVNEAFFLGRTLPKEQRERAAEWIAGRQGLPGSYAGMFAPTDKDFEQGARLFSGEWIRTQAGTAHILGEEACRALILLNVRTAVARRALRRASDGMIGRLGRVGRRTPGMYCCGKCSCALWRHLAVGGLDHSERLLAAGMRALKSHRTGDGRWRVFPFYYTLLALTEIDSTGAVREMRYAAPVCERYSRRKPSEDIVNQRRRLIAERVLARC